MFKKIMYNLRVSLETYNIHFRSRHSLGLGLGSSRQDSIRSGYASGKFLSRIHALSCTKMYKCMQNTDLGHSNPIQNCERRMLGPGIWAILKNFLKFKISRILHQRKFTVLLKENVHTLELFLPAEFHRSLK